MRALPTALLAALLAAPPGLAAQDGFEDGIRIAFGLPRIVAANAYLSRAMVVESVYQATALSGGALVGRIVNTGTLAPGFGGVYQYAPQPTDKLVVHYGGQVHEFVVLEATGDPRAMTSDAWLTAPHRLRYRHTLPGQTEAEISVAFDGAAFESSVRGWTTQWGKRYEVDLRAVGGGQGVRDLDGQDIQTAYDLTGEISGGPISVSVRERHASTLVAAMSLRMLPSQRGSASQSRSTLDNTLTYGGARYRLQDVRVTSGTQARAGQGSAGVTGVEGVLLRDGAPFGRFVFAGGRVFLETPSGTIAMDGAPGREEP